MAMHTRNVLLGSVVASESDRPFNALLGSGDGGGGDGGNNGSSSDGVPVAPVRGEFLLRSVVSARLCQCQWDRCSRMRAA